MQLVKGCVSSRKIYVARRYEQEKNDRIVDERLQGLEYPEEMRDIKESCAALPIYVPLHNFEKKYQPISAGGTQSPPAMLHWLQNLKIANRVECTLRLFGRTNSFWKKGFLIGALLLSEKGTTEKN